MTDPVKTLLRRAAAALAAEWGASHELAWQVPEDAKDRAGWIAGEIPRLAIEDRVTLARLIGEADAVSRLGKPSRDWVFREVAFSFSDLSDEAFVNEGPESRALRLWLHHKEAFDWALRRAEVFEKTDKPKLCTRYRCLPDPDFTISDTALEPFLSVLQRLYKDHDFSGQDAIPDIDIELDRDGNRVAITVHVALSRLESFEDSFSPDGKMEDVALRRPTYWRCRFELASGRLDLVCDRGTKALRQESADAFTELVLGQTDPPVAETAPDIDLTAFIDTEALPKIDSLSEWRIVEVSLECGEYPDASYTVTSESDAWEAACLLTQAPRGELGSFHVTSIVVEALFETGIGVSGRAEKIVRGEIRADGTVRLKHEGARAQLVRDALTGHIDEAE